MRGAEDVTGKVFAVFGRVVAVPAHLGTDAVDAIRRRGGVVVDQIGPGLDYVVIGSGRGAGKADAVRRSAGLLAKGATHQVLDDNALVHLLRIDLQGARMYFAGGFERGDPGVPESLPSALAALAGVSVASELDETVDYAVIGPRRAAGRAEALRQAQALAEGGTLIVLDEDGFFELMRGQTAPVASAGLGGFLTELHSLVDPKKIKRALDMLKKEHFNLYADASPARLVGVVRSQTTDQVYSNVLFADGRYACADQRLEECMGLQGRVCKHIIVLMLGLVQARQVDVPTLLGWVSAASRKSPTDGAGEVLAETFLRYKGAVAGELDWRPTETLPEDFYAY